MNVNDDVGEPDTPRHPQVHRRNTARSKLAPTENQGRAYGGSVRPVQNL